MFSREIFETDINLQFITGKHSKFVLDDLYNGRYITRLRYKLKLYDLTDEDIYDFLLNYYGPDKMNMLHDFVIGD